MFIQFVVWIFSNMYYIIIQEMSSNTINCCICNLQKDFKMLFLHFGSLSLRKFLHIHGAILCFNPIATNVRFCEIKIDKIIIHFQLRKFLTCLMYANIYTEFNYLKFVYKVYTQTLFSIRTMTKKNRHIQLIIMTFIPLLQQAKTNSIN